MLWLPFSLLLAVSGAGTAAAQDMRSAQAISRLFASPARDIIGYLGKPEETSQYDYGDELYYEYFSKGVSLHCRQGRLITIYFHTGTSGGYDTGIYKPFRGTLPPGISIDLTYEQIIAAFGEPETRTAYDKVPVPFVKLQYTSRGFGFNVVRESGRVMNIYFTRKYAH